MIRYKVHFSLGGYVIVHAESPEKACDICVPMINTAEGETLRATPWAWAWPWDGNPADYPALLKPQAE